MVPPFHFLFLVFYSLKDYAHVTCEEWAKSQQIEQHLQLGRSLLAQGHYDDALSHLHAAIDIDPFNYLSFYTRATAYLGTGKILSGMRDLSKVIELKPDFTSARLQRANLLMKQGHLDEAHIDYEYVLRVDPLNPEANEKYTMIDPLKRDIEMAYSMVEDHNYGAAIDVLSRLIGDLAWDSQLREMRSKSYEAIGDISGAIGDLKAILKSQSENQMRHLKLSELYYTIGDTEEALNAIRECLHFDPDHKGCFTYYKHIKKVAGQLKAIREAINSGDFDDCVVRSERGVNLETRVPSVLRQFRSKHCKCLHMARKYKDAIKVCTKALDEEPDDVEILCDRADSYIALENYEEAIRDFQQAISINDRFHRAHEGLKKAQKLEKQSKKRNYYAILGVDRAATKKEIIKAYRKLAQKLHPDNFPDEQKKEAEKKFIEIAAAKEVLTDPEKRQKFDNGEDPLDPESQQQGFNPFQGFRPFDTGGYTFKFHFS